MDKEKEYFIYLVSCFLNKDTPTGKNVDWNKIYSLADYHDIGGIIGYEVRKLDLNFKPNKQLTSYFNQQIGLSVQDYEKRLTVKNYAQQLLNSYGIDHIFVKGAVIDKYYPAPELRTCGDIDIIVREQDFDKIKDIAKDKNLKIVSIVTEVITLNINNITIEFHKYLDAHTEYFDNIFEMCNNIKGHTFELSEYDHLLYVLCHLCKHLQYLGAGIRMLMDIDVLIRGIKDFDVDYFLSLCEKSGVKKSAQILISLVKLWFNTPVDFDYDISANKSLLDNLDAIIIDGGVFGFQVNSIPSEYVTNENSKTAVLFKLVFPPKRHLKQAYPYYNKNKFLYPVARINRIIDCLFKKRSQSKDAVKQIFAKNDISKIQKELINELELGD